ncbi:MAG: NnrU family protein [Rhizobiales bacterium]|nr:NnrU family protein [Hyphomicrobiales bacterium]
MINLWAAAAFFLAIHLLVSGTALRGKLVSAIGEGPYMGLFSLASLGGIVWLAMAYDQAVLGPNHLYWVAPTWLVHLAPLIMLIAFLIGVIGITTPNPTAVKAEALAAKPDTVRGILRITRHPFLWSVLIWSLLHIAVNGDRAAIIFFGTFAILTALGTVSIDAKKRKSMGESWKGFVAKTSNVPFAAILGGRNQLKLGEFAIWRIALALIIFGGVFYGHLWMFGVSPVPGWAPY